MVEGAKQSALITCGIMVIDGALIDALADALKDEKPWKKMK